MEMPNPDPNLTNRDAIESRYRRYGMYDTDHRIHVGLTNDPEQVISALEYVENQYSRCRADKVFYCHSTGNMGILDPDMQKRIWEIKARMGYRGVSIGHFEAEDLYLNIPFEPRRPASHSERQCEMAEIGMVGEQIRNAWNAGFKGTFYIAHVSSPDTVEHVRSETYRAPFRVVLEATWHHLFLNADIDYSIHGNRVKMNPPLRSRRSQERLLDQLLHGGIDLIGTDHAPHPVGRKDDPENPPSGIPALPFWPRGIQLLKQLGMKQSRIDDVTFRCARDLFNLPLRRREVEVEYDSSRWDKYGYNPFSRLDKW